MTAKEWRERNPNLNGNIRDYANVIQLIILSNLENLNAEMIEQKITQKERLKRLNHIASKQFEILKGNRTLENLDELNKRNNKLLS